MAPKSKALKIAATTYLVACLAVLAFAVAMREYRDAEIVVAYAMLLLSFPVGYVVALTFGAVGYVLESTFGTAISGGLGNNIVGIFLFGAAGDTQWFLLVPWLYRMIRHPSNNTL